MQKVSVNQSVRVNTKWGTYKVCDAPTGGRTEDGGPIHTKPFAFLIATAHVLSSHRRLNNHDNAPTLQLGEEFEIEGYGIHKLEQTPMSGDEVFCIRVSDGLRA